MSTYVEFFLIQYKCLTAFSILLLPVLDNREQCKRARKKEMPNFAEFSSKNQVSVSLVMLKSK